MECAFCGKQIDENGSVLLAVIGKKGSRNKHLCSDVDLSQFCTFRVLGGRGISYDHFFNKEREPTRFFRGKRVTAILEKMAARKYMLWTVPSKHHDSERLIG